MRLGVLAGCAALVLGTRFAWGSPAFAMWFQALLGYWVVLVLLGVSAVALGRAIAARGWLAASRWGEHRGALVIIALTSVLLHVNEPHMMRVIYDEPTHAATALAMDLNQAALAPNAANWVGESFVVGQLYPVSRPYLFPALVSLLDDATGYRVANVFVLNALLTPLLLLAAYLLAWRLAGRLAGLTAVLLLGTLPLLAQNVTSGGYDVLNLVLVGALMLLSREFWGATGERRAVLMDASLVPALLLACVRPESVLYVVPWAVIVAQRWRREGEVTLTPLAAIAPLFLLPPLMSNLHMTANAVAMVGDLRTGGQSFFDVRNLASHVPDAITWLFTVSRDATSSALLSALGLAGLVWFAVRARGERAVLALMLTTVLLYVFVLTQFWSSPLDPLATRFALPVLFVFAVAAGWLVARVPPLVKHPLILYGAVLAWALAVTLPASARSTQTRLLTPAWAERYFLNVAGRHDRRATLYVTQSVATLISHRYAAALPHELAARPETYVRALKAGLYHDVLVLQLMVAGNGDTWHPRENQDLPDNIVLEPVEQRMVGLFGLARVSRLVGYRKADGTLVTPASADPAVHVQTDFPDYAAWQRYRLSIYP